ncbi:MAG: ABC transporter substrate-binding protein [Candidatus Thiodiazotropha sp. 6PLUC9]
MKTGDMGACITTDWHFGVVLLYRNICLAMLLSISQITHAAPEIKVGAVFDQTGGISIYGIQQSKAIHLAVDNINRKGGLLGRKLKLIEYDSQSNLDKYAQYTKTLILRDRISVLFAGLTSSSREVIRPIIRKYKTLYFYGCHYEGGACDKYTFVTGVSASQQMRVLIPWAIRKFGPKLYIMGPDYNFGTISGVWVNYYAKRYGGQVLGEEYLPLTMTDYSPTIERIKAAKPDFVFTLPVGPKQNQFLEQFSASGLKQKIGMVSTNYGSGNQQIAVSPGAGENIVSSLEYFHWAEETGNDELKKLWREHFGLDEPIIAPAVNVWNAVHLWAEAVRKTGSIDTDEVIATLERGLSYNAPNGQVTLRPRSHHLRQNMYIARGNRRSGFDIIEVHKGVDPFFEDAACDLIERPETAEHFTPEGY